MKDLSRSYFPLISLAYSTLTELIKQKDRKFKYLKELGYKEFIQGTETYEDNYLSSLLEINKL